MWRRISPLDRWMRLMTHYVSWDAIVLKSLMTESRCMQIVCDSLAHLIQWLQCSHATVGLPLIYQPVKQRWHMQTMRWKDKTCEQLHRIMSEARTLTEPNYKDKVNVTDTRPASWTRKYAASSSNAPIARNCADLHSNRSSALNWERCSW